MFNFILNIGLLTMLGGRNLLGDGVGGERLIFRALLPAMCTFAVALTLGMSGLQCGMLFGVVLAGSALWAIPGWSFDEINGQYDATKYPSLIRKAGLHFVPAFDESSNRKRGIIMKGLRGLYDYPMYLLLATINPIIALYGLSGVAMGLIYWACGRVVTHERYSVILAEFAYGCWRGLWIYLTIKAI